MARVRDTAAIRVGATVPTYRPRRAPQERPAEVLGTVEVCIDGRVLEVARELAGGDLARLLLNPDGSVTVANSREHRAVLQKKLGGVVHPQL